MSMRRDEPASGYSPDGMLFPFSRGFSPPQLRTRGQDRPQTLPEITAGEISIFHSLSCLGWISANT